MAKKRAARVAIKPDIPASRDLKTAPLETAASGTTRFADAAGYSLIFCATLLAYLPALNGTLLWDDNRHVTSPELTSLHGLWRIWFEIGAIPQYYPLLHTAFWLEHRVWGDAVFGYHVTNILLHAFSACLVVLIMRRLALPGAWLGGFIFALHPVNAEAVAWISEQKSTLSGVFCLGALLAYLCFDQDRRKSQYVVATLLFVLALLSKTVTATLPAALLVVFWWQRGHLTWKRDVLPLLPWFGLGISAGLFTAWMEETFVGARGADFLLTPFQRVLIAGRAICFYAVKIFWPVNLAFSYPHWNVDPSVWWQWVFPGGIVALGIGLALVARHYRGPLASLLIFSGTLFPVLGFFNVFPFRYSYVADHFQYLASLGIIVPVASIVARAVERASSQKTFTVAFCGALILIPGVLTWRQSHMYSDDETLFRQTILRNPQSWMAHNNLGMLLARTPGSLPIAIAEYQEALRINPNFEEARNNLGIALSQIPGRLPEAIAEYQAALRIDPYYAETHDNLGSALARIPGRSPDAIAEYQAALRLRPDLKEAHYSLGRLLEEVPGQLQASIAEYQAALSISPYYADAHDGLGTALARIPGRLPEAIAEYQTALQINPDYAEAHSDLGIAIAEISGRLPDAIAEFQTALRIDPNDAVAHYSLGNAFAQTPGQQSEAIAEYQAAIRINPDYAEAHNNLGSILVQIPGRLPDAITEFRAAVRIRPDFAETHNNLGMLLAHIPGKLPEAIAEYQAALRIKPDYAQARDNLANAMTQMKTPARD